MDPKILTGVSVGAALLSALTFSHNIVVRNQAEDTKEELNKTIQEHQIQISKLESKIEQLTTVHILF